MKQAIKRYSLAKQYISSGILTVAGEGQTILLTFKDSVIEVNVSGLNHPLVAMESLRRILETEYESIIGCNGCRIDTSYRPTGGYGTYKIISGKQATKLLNIFEATDKIEKLCTVDQHKEAYRKWLDSLR